MKYFTPDLLARFRSGESDSTEWDRAGAAYEKRLESLGAAMPPRVLRALDSICFHDAKVLTMSADESPHLSIFLKLNGAAQSPDKYVELRYRLANGIKTGLKLLRHPILAADGKPLGWWLYDELDVSKKGPRPTFTHSIVFTGGYEMQVMFTSVTTSKVRFFLPQGSVEPEDPLDALQLLTA